jgi:hypothetical protein
MERQTLTHVEFRSDRFPALPDEDKLVNPGRWGKRLADFLCENLPRESFQTKKPFAEDWGWVVPIVNDSFRLWIGCGNYDDPEGFLCFIELHKPFVRRLFRKVDARERVAGLQRTVDRILTDEAGIRDKRWWTYEEFNPRRSKHHSGHRPSHPDL